MGALGLAATFLFLGAIATLQAGEPEKDWPSAGSGGQRDVFSVAGKKAFLLLPTKAAADGSKPWLWYAPTIFGRFPAAENDWLFNRLRANGFAIGGVDVGESWGNPQGRAGYTEFYRFVVAKYGLSPKACLLPQSRGGLMLYNWAVEHPEWIECIGGIYPICDISTCPGLPAASSAYGMTEAELRAHLAEHNPVERLGPLAQAKVPIFHVHGKADKVVPLAQNSAELARRYRALGGRMELVIIEGKGHEVCAEFFESSPLLDFLLARGKEGQRKPE